MSDPMYPDKLLNLDMIGRELIKVSQELDLDACILTIVLRIQH